ncbi:hypothetical protein [Glycomyces arizonensis]|uniref:hypothetical protein n=1 Tax=Glycomyces arizonensis TaxID=256035 RepID=UPI0003F6039E|nr:hypothetical protein [Glycomyces arizonensis]
MGTGTRSRLHRLAAVFALALSLAACSSLAASTGTKEDQLTAVTHSQVQTARLAAEAGLEDPPAPAVTLTVVLDDARTELVGTQEDLAKLPGDHEDLAGLVEDAIALVDRTATAIEDGDRPALREALRQAEALATALEDRSEKL